MKYFFISFLDLRFEGRTIELVNTMKKFSPFVGVTKGDYGIKQSDNHLIIENNNSYVNFIFKTINFSNKIENFDYIFIDNRKSILPALIINLKRKKKIIYDMREFYLADKTKSIKRFFGSLLEKHIINKADFILCANDERTTFVKKKFKPKGYVFSYKNIRKLNYTNTNKTNIESKYSKFFKNKKFRIISTSGSIIERGNDKLVLSASKFKNKIELFLVGGGSKKDRKTINNIIEKNLIKNVKIFDKLNHDELKYIISKCDCGIVNYHSKDLNNKYCASGKLYEFIFEEKPVITTSNPPLKKMTEKYNLGCSGENYDELIKKMLLNYDKYFLGVKEYKKKISVKENNDNLYRFIKDKISSEANND